LIPDHPASDGHFGIAQAGFARVHVEGGQPFIGAGDISEFGADPTFEIGEVTGAIEDGDRGDPFPARFPATFDELGKVLKDGGVAFADEDFHEAPQVGRQSGGVAQIAFEGAQGFDEDESDGGLEFGTGADEGDAEPHEDTGPGRAIHEGKQFADWGVGTGVRGGIGAGFG